MVLVCMHITIDNHRILLQHIDNHRIEPSITIAFCSKAQLLLLLALLLLLRLLYHLLADVVVGGGVCCQYRYASQRLLLSAGLVGSREA